MSSIENYWDDVIIYLVEFTTDEVHERIMKKILIFPVEFSIDEIRASVIKNFDNIKCVNIIDEYFEGLCLKRDMKGHE